MVRCIVSTLVVFCLLVAGAIYESSFTKKQFGEFNDVLGVLYQKIEDEEATIDDVYAVQENWLNKKKSLHIFIPHNEIKEIELWISEAVKCVKEGKFSDASIKLEVVAELTEQVPKNFKFTFENIL